MSTSRGCVNQRVPLRGAALGAVRVAAAGGLVFHVVGGWDRPPLARRVPWLMFASLYHAESHGMIHSSESLRRPYIMFAHL